MTLNRRGIPRSTGRGWWRGVLLSSLVLALAGCQSHESVSTPATIPTGEGVVVGGIDACSGLPVAKSQGFVAGTVTVLRGTVKPIPNPGVGVSFRFPTERVASEFVARHQSYRFDLKPGRYVLRGRYAAGGNVEPWTYAVIRAGQVTRQNIPNVCK